MPAKWNPPNPDDIIQSYRAGRSAYSIAIELGTTNEVVQRFLARNGVTVRGCSGAAKLRTDRPKWSPPDLSVLIARFENGESVKALGVAYQIERSAIIRVLRENGITPRTRSEGMYARMAQTSAAERALLSSAAHDAVRGRKVPPDERIRNARTREIHVTHVGAGEVELIRTIAEISQGRLVVTPQKAVGPYNIDLAYPPVAVEVSAHTGNPVCLPRLRQRTKYLIDLGWSVLYVWITKAHRLTETAAEYAVAFIDQTQADPSAPGVYRVIRGSGELVSAGSDDLN